MEREAQAAETERQREAERQGDPTAEKRQVARWHGAGPFDPAAPPIRRLASRFAARHGASRNGTQITAAGLGG
ncbi:hypothetical protein GCM10011390_13440 [Aureimonas endophytica]|uniref:Uncharacterized protein n=1 Tax=Aureimonas endophytica TaxID=2027858 RepID=A0A917E2B5_9HYPH|nr:hypothetical protein GCM10011390_13440 [Aureimonas endophytica]